MRLLMRKICAFDDISGFPLNVLLVNRAQQAARGAVPVANNAAPRRQAPAASGNAQRPATTTQSNYPSNAGTPAFSGQQQQYAYPNYYQGASPAQSGGAAAYGAYPDPNMTRNSSRVATPGMSMQGGSTGAPQTRKPSGGAPGRNY